MLQQNKKSTFDNFDQFLIIFRSSQFLINSVYQEKIIRLHNKGHSMT
jgi:hypothetical protein